jgi:hypothetical protein
VGGKYVAHPVGDVLLDIGSLVLKNAIGGGTPASSGTYRNWTRVTVCSKNLKDNAADSKYPELKGTLPPTKVWRYGGFEV